MKKMEIGKDISKCINSLKNGGVVAYPTDTVYGLGADIGSLSAVERLYKMKGRDFDKPFLLNIGEKSLLNQYVKNISELEQLLVDKLWPGKVSIIFDASDEIPEYIHKGMGTIGVRMPDNDLALKLLRSYGGALISTSVNVSGDPPLLSSNEVKAQFSDYVDYLLGENETCSGIPSTIVRVINDKITILRSGSCDEEVNEIIAHHTK